MVIFRKEAKAGRIILALLMIIGLWLLPAGASPAEKEKAQPQKNQAKEAQILITSDQVEFDPQNEIATYTGQVTVTQENTSLYADRIEVHFTAKGKNITLIKAFGNIRIIQEDRLVTAEEGIYYQQDRKVVLTGNPVTRQGNNCISGDKIVYLWDQGKALVEGNVKATIIMDREKMEKLRPN
ncbi:MAG: lipopolysaccharide transport periplasmic protein LptA [bacterium]